MLHTPIPSTDVLAEAAAIASHALGVTLPPDDAQAFRTAVGNDFLAETFLAVAGHVCDLRKYRSPAATASETASRPSDETEA